MASKCCLRYPFDNGGFKLQYNFELRQAFSRTEVLKVNERRALRIGAGDRIKFKPRAAPSKGLDHENW